MLPRRLVDLVPQHEGVDGQIVSSRADRESAICDTVGMILQKSDGTRTSIGSAVDSPRNDGNLTSRWRNNTCLGRIDVKSGPPTPLLTLLRQARKSWLQRGLHPRFNPPRHYDLRSLRWTSPPARCVRCQLRQRNQDTEAMTCD